MKLRTNRRRRTLAIGVSAVAVALITAACSSSGASGGGTSGGGSSGGGSSSGGTSGSGTSAAVARAENVVQQAGVRPTAITISTPVGKPIPKHEKVFYISCALDFCQTYGDLMSKASTLLGWDFTSIPTDGSTQAQQNAMQSAINHGANGIIMQQMVASEFTSQLAEAKAKGIGVITCCTTSTEGGGLTYTNDENANTTQAGQWLAALVIADSKAASNTNALYVNVPAALIVAQIGSTFEATYKGYCASCKYASMDIPASAIGTTAPDLIVAYLRAHPSVNYVVMSVADEIGVGLPGALAAAGLSGKVKVMGWGSSPTIVQYVESGQMAATVVNDYYTNVYLEIDALARFFAGVPVIASAQNQWLIQTGTKVPSIANGIFPVVADYQAQFQQLWGAGS
jgi:ABC-type sugar transport system substrate-binding protein